MRMSMDNETTQEAENNEAADGVVVYSTPSCHFCHMAKEFFTENNVAYTEHNVQDDVEKRNEMMEATGQMGVPVIKIKGEYVIGFNEAKIREMLGL